MDTSTVAAKAVANAVNAAGSRPDQDAANGDAFSALLRAVGSRFKSSANTLDGGVIRDEVPRAEPKAEPRDDRKDVRDDRKATAADESDAESGREECEPEAEASAEASATAAPVPDQTQAMQLAALQAQILTVATPATAPAPVATETTVALPSTAPALVEDAPTTAAPVETLAAPTDAAAQIAAGTDLTAGVPTTDDGSSEPNLPAPDIKPAATTVDAQAVVTPTGPATHGTGTTEFRAAPLTTPVAAQTPTTEGTAAVPSETAKSQADALARMLGSDQQIKVKVTVEQPKTATPSMSAFNPFVGYTMGDVVSLANGQFGQAGATNALTTDSAQTNGGSPAPAPAQAQPVPGPVTPATPLPVRGEGPTTAFGVMAAATAGGASGQGDLGQSSLGASGGNTQGTAQTKGTAAADAPRQPATPSQVFEQIKVHVTRATKAGLNQVTIQLRPDDLGRVDVKLEVQDGKVRALVIAEKPETLQLLQSDARGLERALNESGLRTDASLLEFSLRGDGDSKAHGFGGGAQGRAGAATAEAAPAEPTEYDYSQAARLRGGVDTYV